MSEHGFMRPNPALLYDLEQSQKLKSRPIIAHDLGAGQLCVKCGPKCPGFQLHFWRKHCTNCRCGKADHSVLGDEDGGADGGCYFIGKLFDRPLRTTKEELEFCYGNVLDEVDTEGLVGILNNSKISDGGKKQTSNGKKVKFDWIPHDVSDRLARKYLNEMPESAVPIAGSQGAHVRQKMLEKQFPIHDIEPEKCHDLPPEELKSMQDYVGHVKKEVAGLGVIYEINKPKFEYIDDDDLPPPPPEFLTDFNDEEPTYVNIQKEGALSSGIIHSTHGTTKNGDKLYHARPYHLETNEDIGGSNLIKEAMKNPIIPAGKKCENCKEVLATGEVAISAERAGPIRIWHPRCFRCCDCKELLVGLLYYYKSGKVYCARDYAKVANIPRCAACDELIFTNEFTGAEERVWHLRHFCCWECDKPLAGHKYVPDENGQPHCLYCFQQKHGKICRTCGEYIAPEEERLSLPLKSAMVSSNPSSGDENTERQKSAVSIIAHWHATPQCFQCQICHKSLLGTKMTMKFGLVLCSSVCAARAAETQYSPKHTTLMESDL